VRSHGDQRGLSAIEVIVALAIFGVLLLVMTSLQAQFHRFDRQADFALFEHPQQLAVVERVRADVLDSRSYPVDWRGWTQSTSTLILRRSGESNEVIVWSFGEGSPAERRTWEGDTDTPSGRWVAHNVPNFEVTAVSSGTGRVGVNLKGFDEEGRLVFDQILFPRAH
jgi:prepilin-type N-terminal cleavage/methylation domain-containing protein